MASQRLSSERNRQDVFPENFNIRWGDDSRFWRLPDKDYAYAELISVSWLEVVAVAIDIKPLANNSILAKFYIKKLENYFGWEGADVRIGVKLGTEGDFYYKSVTDQLHEMKEPGPLQIVVDVPDDVVPSDDKIYFGLFDIWTLQLKGGLQFIYAEIDYDQK